MYSLIYSSKHEGCFHTKRDEIRKRNASLERLVYILFALKRNLYRFLCMSFLLDHEVLNLLVTLVGVYSIMSLSCDHMIYPFRESMQGLCDGFYCGGVAHMPTGYSFIQYFYASHAFNHVSLSIVQTSLSFLHSKKPLYQSKTHSKHYIVTRNPVYSRRLDPSVLAFSFSLYRHPSIYILCSSRFTSHNKHLIPKDLTANNTQERRTTIGIRMMVVRNSRR